MRRQRDERRREIAAAALELLAEGGPRQLTTRNLGARVDMDGSSLFRHFGNKGEILHAAIDLFEAALGETIPESAPSWESLRIFFLQRLALVQARPEVIQLAFNQHLLVVSGELDHAARVREIVARSVSFIRACLERAQSDGLISRTVPAAAQVWVVTGMLRGAAQGSMEPRPTPNEAWQWLASILQEESRSS
ncbi:MAG: TetR/AcrR family transcriptional regulator [Sandaracinaceae bacterium]|nr:TetR/AcrR family transcriptional regulator [Sandaracinaceae bacterium]